MPTAYDVLHGVPARRTASASCALAPSSRHPCSAGWLPPAEATPCRGLLKLDLRAHHVGTGMLRMRAWLLDLRRTIGNTNAPCLLDKTKRVCIISGTDGDDTGGGGVSDRAATQVLSRLKGELGASLVRFGAPFRLVQEGGRAQRIESSTAMVRKWLFSGRWRAMAGLGRLGGVWACARREALASPHVPADSPPLPPPTPPPAPNTAESFNEWDRVFSGGDAVAATGAATGDVEARMLVEGQLQQEAVQVGWVAAGLRRGCRGGGAAFAGAALCAADPAATPRPLDAQAYARVTEYEATHALDAQALQHSDYAEWRGELVRAAHALAAGLGLGGSQRVWHAAVVLLDRCAAAGYQPRMPAMLAAACVALAAAREQLALDTTLLAAQLDPGATLQALGAEPAAALQAEMHAVAAALQGDTACISGEQPVGIGAWVD